MQCSSQYVYATRMGRLDTAPQSTQARKHSLARYESRLVHGEISRIRPRSYKLRPSPPPTQPSIEASTTLNTPIVCLQYATTCTSIAVRARTSLEPLPTPNLGSTPNNAYRHAFSLCLLALSFSLSSRFPSPAQPSLRSSCSPRWG